LFVIIIIMQYFFEGPCLFIPVAPLLFRDGRSTRTGVRVVEKDSNHLITLIPYLRYTCPDWYVRENNWDKFAEMED
jgi:hypothetical protein